VYFTIALVSGILLGSILLIVTRRNKLSENTSSARPTWSAWLTLALGITAAAVFAVAMIDARKIGTLMWAAITLPVATMMLGMGGLARGDRRWPTWLGLAFGLLPALFWVVFVVGEVLGPTHA
jgi:peptidoglycan/LPS O-acetylase OafA/YrhL